MSQTAHNNSNHNLASPRASLHAGGDHLAIGIAVGYFARGSAPSHAETAQAAPAPAGMGGGAMGSAQLPGIGTMQQQQAASPEMIAKAAEPLLAQLKTNPNDFETLVKLGKLVLRQPGLSRRRSSTTKKQSAFNLITPDVRTDLGTAYWYTGNADKAIANFEKALAIRPNHPGTLFNLGIVRWQGKKDPKGAIVAWEKLLQTNPDYPQKDQVQMLIERAKMHGSRCDQRLTKRAN